MTAGRSAYDRIESLHVRQGLQRIVPWLGVLALNGAGWVDVPWLPRFGGNGLGAGPGSGPDLALAGTGAVLVVAAASLRVAAKGVLVRKRTVTACGVYGRVRHPYYLANLAGCLGVLLLAGVPGALTGCAWLAAAFPLFLLTIRGEEEGLQRLHGATWEEYAARVPRLLPVPWSRARGPTAPVTWANLVAEHEPPRLLRFLAGAVLVASCRHAGAAAWCLGAAAGALFLGSHAVALATRRPR